MAANTEFEQMVGKLREFSVEPAATDWEAIELRLRKPRRRRWLIWPLLLAVAAFTGYMVWNAEPGTPEARNSSATIQAKGNPEQKHAVSEALTSTQKQVRPGTTVEQMKKNENGEIATTEEKIIAVEKPAFRNAVPWVKNNRNATARVNTSTTQPAGTVGIQSGNGDVLKGDLNTLETRQHKNAEISTGGEATEAKAALHHANPAEKQLPGNHAISSANLAKRGENNKEKQGEEIAKDPMPSEPVANADSANTKVLFATPAAKAADSIKPTGKPVFKKQRAWMVYAGIGQSKAVNSLSVSANKAMLEDMGGGFSNTTVVSSNTQWQTAFAVGASRLLQLKPALALHFGLGYNYAQQEQELSYRRDSTVFGGGQASIGLLQTNTRMHLLDPWAQLQFSILRKTRQQAGLKAGFNSRFVAGAKAVNKNQLYTPTNQPGRVTVSTLNADSAFYRFQPALSAGLFWQHRLGKHRAQLQPGISYSLRPIGSNNGLHLLQYQLQYFFQIK